jgi:flagellar motor switch protein FliG
MLGGAMLGARKSAGMAALRRAIALGSATPLVPSYAAILQMVTNPDDPGTARHLAEVAAAAPAADMVNRVAKANAEQLLVSLRSGNRALATKTADRLLPFGTLL